MITSARSFFAILLLSSLPANAQEAVDFARQVRPILAGRCYACHGPDGEAREAGLRLDRREDAIADRGGEAVIVPGDAEASQLVQRIVSADDSERMPPAEHAPQLGAEEVRILRRWISEGAVYTAHWAYEAPRLDKLPRLSDAADPIDAFARATLAEYGLSPSGPASPRTLLRRVTLDLIGLPPTVEALRRFEADPSDAAYAREVDRLLGSPAYSERWAAVWLDLARYADSSGYGSDPLRTIWRYRDWVIEAFDRNQPFDRFTIDQLAGDLLPGATREQRLATAFHRNTPTNTEGGTDDEEFRVAAVKDRANTTFQVWMGLTLGCAQCHDHKFDPISQREYYQAYAFFDQTADRDRNNDAPRLETPTRSTRERRAVLFSRREALRDRSALLEESAGRWGPLEIRDLRPEAEHRVLSDGPGGWRTEGPLAEKDRLRIAASIPREGLGALRLTLLPTEASGALSRSTSNGNVVLSEWVVRAKPRVPLAVARVRVRLPGAQRILHLAEVEVFAGAENLARRGTARQSSTGFGGPAERAIDGNTDGRYDAASVTHCATESNPWWEVELEEASAIDRIVVHNRTDADLERRLDGAIVELLDVEGGVLLAHHIRRADAARFEVDLAEGVSLPLSSPRADFAQSDWLAEHAVDGDKATGWALAPRQRQEHWIAVEIDAPWLDAQHFELELELLQAYGEQHLIGRARLEARSPLPEGLRSLREESAELDGELAGLKPVTTPVMEELPPNRRRTTRVLLKGNFLTPGQTVQPAVPAAFHPWPEGAPRDRLGLAQWLVDPANPLTARVTVNRVWARLFGSGLVETEEDFGIQGTLPSHPELLDWLALDFMASGWDFHHLLRRLVLSAPYRRTSIVDEETRRRDPRGRLLTRGPRLRLEAEMVRDQALSFAGLMSRKRLGPSVFPPQPDGLWQAAFNGQRNWNTSPEEDRHRRALYTFLRRTVPYPSMAIFDAPSREVCTLRRHRTNTPLQAFVTLNDPVYVEAAEALAARLQEHATTDVERVSYGLELCTARRPSDAEVRVLVDLLEDQRRFGAEAEGERERDAWIAIASALLNLDSVLSKG